MSQKGFSVILIILGMVVVAGGLIYGAYYLGKMKSNPQEKNPVVTSSPSSNPDETANPDSIGANWKTYTDQVNKFSIKYPKEWREEVDEEIKNRVLLTPDSVEFRGGQEQGIHINIVANKNNLSSRQYLDQVAIPAQNGSVCEGKIKVISNIPNSLKNQDVTVADGFCGIFNEGSRMYIANRDTIIILSSGFQEINRDLIDQIYSTFKFLDQNQVNDISNWKTFTNTRGGYSVKYPAQVSVDENGNFSFQNGNYYTINILASTTSETRLHELNPSKIDQVIIDACPNFIGQKSCSDSQPGPIPNSLQFDTLNRHYASTITVVKNGNIIYEIDLSTNNPNLPISNEAKQIYNQILSTFKFQ